MGIWIQRKVRFTTTQLGPAEPSGWNHAIFCQGKGGKTEDGVADKGRLAGEWEGEA